MIFNDQGPPLPKVGVDTLKYQNDDIFEYRSTLFKTTGANQESYLQLLYSQRNKWPKFVMGALHALLQTCILDQPRGIFQYIHSLEPPTYIQARYLDWVRPFIGEQIDFNLRNQNLSGYQTDLTNALQCNQIFT